MADMITALTELSSRRSELRNNLSAMGVLAPINDTLLELIEKVLQIPTEAPKIPFALTARDLHGPLVNQPLSRQADNEAPVVVALDENGEHRAPLDIVTEYTFEILPASESDDIFPAAPKKVVTDKKTDPLTLDFLVARGSDLVNPDTWEHIKDTISGNSGKTAAISSTAFGSLSGSGKWVGGVLAPNGKIYGIPLNSTQMLEIDPGAQSAVPFGSLSSDTGKWSGGVLAPNGKIYGIPNNSTQVLEFDPDTHTFSFFGSLSGSSKWYGGVLAPNGKIYGIPYNSTQVLEIDPGAQSAVPFGSLSGSAKWNGGVLAPNGKIYGIPYHSTQMLEIDFGTGLTHLSLPSVLSAFINKR